MRSPSKSHYCLLQDIEQAIVQKVSLVISKQNQESLTALPQRVVYVEGELCLIAESAQDHSLLNLPLKEIHDVDCFTQQQEVLRSSLDVNEYIKGVRLVNESSIRLVLKVKQTQFANLLPKYHFFDNPCLVVNFEGDFIWAANVEPSLALYDWIASQGEGVEILDPSSAIEGFSSYCLAYKKKESVA